MKRILQFSAAFGLLILIVGFTLPVHASSFVVNTTTDSTNGSCGTPCSLRDAIAAADSAPGADTITFSVNGIFSLSHSLTLSTDLTITGNGTANTIIDGGNSVRIFAVTDATVSISGVTIQNGSTGGNGGGILNTGTLTITDSTLASNTGNNGGGIINIGTLTVSNSLFESNTTLTNAVGGGIYNSAGTVTVTNSTFYQNSALAGGGGIFSSIGTLTVINSTFYQNTAGFGGALMGAGPSQSTVINSTFYQNSSTGSAGSGIYVNANHSMNVYNSILADGASDDCESLGTITFEYTLINSTATCGASDGVDGNIIGIDPNLGTYANYVIPLLAGSPAIDAGDNSLIPIGITTDAIGNNRIYNGTVDLGAVESTFNNGGGGSSDSGNTGASGASVSALCANLTALSNNAVTVSGGGQNVLLNGVYGSTYCRLIAYDGSYVTSPAEIGVESVIGLGVVDAVNVFGQLPGGDTVVPFIAPVTVCLRGTGEVLFLSAADSSRTPQHLAATLSGAYTCASVPNSGTVVLVGQASNIPEQSADTSASMTELTSCRVTTTHSPLNLRAEPNTSATVIEKLPFNLSLTATARVPGWYQVVYLDGQGWVSDQFVSTAGNCN